MLRYQVRDTALRARSSVDDKRTILEVVGGVPCHAETTPTSSSPTCSRRTTGASAHSRRIATARVANTTRASEGGKCCRGSGSSPRGAGRARGRKRQNERKKLFSVGMIGAPPPAWTLRTKPDKSDLPGLPPEPYYESPGERPKCRFSDPEMFDDVGLSPVGRARLKRSKHQPNGLPPGWKEHFIGDTFSKTDAQANLENSVFLDDKNAEIVDKGRVYFYHEETGQVCFAPPKGSSPLAVECFLHFGRVLVEPRNQACRPTFFFVRRVFVQKRLRANRRTRLCGYGTPLYTTMRSVKQIILCPCLFTVTSIVLAQVHCQQWILENHNTFCCLSVSVF